MRLTHRELLEQPVVEPHWIVHDMIDRGTLILLAGEAGAGKSFLSYQLAYCVATGLPFLGFQTVPTPVLYFDEENARHHVQQYCQWIWRGLGKPEVPALDIMFHLHSFGLDERWPSQMRELAGDLHPGLIVVDTATPALHIENENDNAEAARVIGRLRSVQRIAANETTVLVLKHEKQRDDTTHRRTVRGAKAWEGACDAILYQAKRPGKPRKNGWSTTRLEPGKLRAFGLRAAVDIDPTEVGTEPKGMILKRKSSKAEDEES